MSRFKGKRYSYDTFQGNSVTPMARFKEKRYFYDTFQGKALIL